MLELREIWKSFGATRVLRGVSMHLREREIHVLAGANGAGKSTLIKILTGAITQFDGELKIAEKTRRFRDPNDARRAGVSAIHQELSLVPAMSVLDNVFLGREPLLVGLRRKQRRIARAAIADLGLDVDVDAPIESLPVSQQQLVEIAKALVAIASAESSKANEAAVLVMDEPTSALNEGEAEALFRRVRALRDRGCAILFVTHRMEEIYALADRITVLRDGVVAATGTPKDLDRDALVAAMLGRELRAVIEGERDRFVEKKHRLEVRALSVDHPAQPGRREVREATLSVERREIVGVAGLAGSGASALLHGIFGSHARRPRGEVFVARQRLRLGDPTSSVAHGLVLVPADRKAQGIVWWRSVRENAALSALRRWSFAGLMRPLAERRDVSTMLDSLHVKASSLEAPIDALSGGNQQKVILGRGLLAEPKVLLLDEPTRGVDVGAKVEIHRKLRALADEGMAVLVATTEIDDLVGLCDRVLVMHRGAIVAELSHAEATRQRVLHAAMGATAATGNCDA